MGVISRLVPVTVLIFAVNASAADIYRWVDGNGIVHFSDTKPADDSAVELLHVGNTNPPGYDPADDPYSIRNQAERMGKTWSRLEEEKEKRREAQREAAARQPVYAYQPYDPYTSHYRGYHYPYYRPGLRPPAHPSQRPPLQGPTMRRQATAMDELGLTGTRPHSINSGRHQARVESSADFLQAVSGPPPRPAPHER